MTTLLKQNHLREKKKTNLQTPTYATSHWCARTSDELVPAQNPTNLNPLRKQTDKQQPEEFLIKEEKKKKKITSEGGRGSGSVDVEGARLPKAPAFEDGTALASERFLSLLPHGISPRRCLATYLFKMSFHVPLCLLIQDFPNLEMWFGWGWYGFRLQ